VGDGESVDDVVEEVVHQDGISDPGGSLAREEALADLELERRVRIGDRDVLRVAVERTDREDKPNWRRVENSVLFRHDVRAEVRVVDTWLEHSVTKNTRLAGAGVKCTVG
jgi:hypothetical protein